MTAGSVPPAEMECKGRPGAPKGRKCRREGLAQKDPELLEELSDAATSPERCAGFMDDAVGATCK